MKVIHVAPFSSAGGMAYVANLIGENKQALGDLQWEEIDTTPPERLQGLRWNRTRLMIQFARSIWRALAPSHSEDEPRVLHVHTGSSHSFFEKSLFVALGRMRGARTVLHVHGASFDRFCASAGPVVRRIVVRLLQMPDRIVVLSSYWAHVFRRMLPDAEEGRLWVLHNGVEVPALSIQNGRDGSFKVLFIGCVGDRKGCGEILDAAAQLSELQDLQFYLLGGGDFEGDLRRYKKEAASRRLTNVRFLGHTTGRDKEEMLRSADLFILPSRAENFPIALLEAMAYGLPAVATRVGAMPEVVEAKNGILIEPRDADALAKAITYLYERPEERAAMGEQNTRKIREQYGAARFVEEVRALYESLTE